MFLNQFIELDDASIYNYFADNTRFFKEEFLSLLSTIDIYFIEDTKSTSYIYFKNCAVKITKDSVTYFRLHRPWVVTFGKTM